MKKSLLILLLAAVMLSSCGSVEQTGQETEAVTETEAIEPIIADEVIIQQNEKLQPVPFVSEVKVDFAEMEASVSGAVSENATEVPTVTAYKHSHNTKIVITGQCEEDSVVIIRGGLKETRFHSDGIDFAATADIPAEGITQLYITVQAPGKDESAPIVLTVKARDNVTMFEDNGIYGVINGDNYQAHFHDAVADYEGTNLLSESAFESLQKRITDRVTYCTTEGRNTEIIYLIVPNPMTVYPETVPDEYTMHEGDGLLEQFTDAAEAAGASVIDLSETLIAHRDDEHKIFMKTDSHWTKYGAFLGYTDLMNHIAKKFPAAAPRGAEDFRFYEKRVQGGDVPLFLELDFSRMMEDATFCELLFEVPTGEITIYNENEGRTDINHSTTSKVQTVKNKNGEGLPTAMVHRDSFAGPIFTMLNERFSEVYWTEMWDYSFDKKKLDSMKPDYLLYIITERNIKNILY